MTQSPDLVVVDRGEGDVAWDDDQGDEAVSPVGALRSVHAVHGGVADQLDLAVGFRCRWGSTLTSPAAPLAFSAIFAIVRC